MLVLKVTSSIISKTKRVVSAKSAYKSAQEKKKKKNSRVQNMQPKEYGDTWGISLRIWDRVKEIGSEHPSKLLNIKWQKNKENQIFQAETLIQQYF